LHRIQRYIELIRLFFRLSLMRQMAYRPHFFMMVLGKIIRMGLLFFFFQAIFFKVNRIGQWSFDQVLLLFATFHIVDYLMSITFQRNLAFYLTRRVHTGELDERMLLPVPLLFLISFEELDMIDFFSFLPCLGFLLYVGYRLDFAFSALQVLSYTLLVLNALLFLYAVILIIATTCFWTTQAFGLGIIFDNLLRIGRYPLDIFEGFWKLLFVYFLPLVLVAQVPAQALIGMLSLPFTVYSIAVSGLFLVAAVRFWRWGLKHYQSASS
jgi:ABC-2 type transport system permease protein